MGIFPAGIISTIKNCAYQADKLARSDLIANHITTENDYTSNFTSFFRHSINALKIFGLSSRIQQLHPPHERKFGADGCIIFHNITNHTMKVGIFEAKWPRLSTHKDCWDSIQTTKNTSHFHDQLRRQATKANVWAIWEMFYCEFPFRGQPAFMPPEGSACVWHSPAYAASNKRPNPAIAWRDSDLEQLLKNHPMTISEVITDICKCHEGVELPATGFDELFQGAITPEEVLIVEYFAS
ncbi:hypothetical protein [Pseudomonas sp. OV226]|uniref:hypothetical protein n=1 Tax=Pseudomonas sp. OV226 TaxID=2135588 RepID=UPI000D6D194F|nr:hypothetical protein [Pseudomonas sp. OV226]PWK45520.1 hypothetical protein C7534_101106 [Pseudomonas sp. OV226]